MRPLVTGAAGFLGTELVSRLLAAGYRDIRCLVRPGHDVSALETAARRAGARLDLIRGSMTSGADVARAVDGVDVIFHLAAAMRGSAADMFLNTVVGSRRLLDAAAHEDGPRIVLVSSFGVYGVAALRRGGVVDESTPLEPHPERRDPYSYSKWRQEKLFFEYRERTGFPVIVLRPGVIYGPGGAPVSARVGVNVFGTFLSVGGGNTLPLCHVSNCADALVAAATRDDAVGEAFNVCDDDLPSCRRYLRLYRRSVRPMRVVPVPYPAMWLLSWAVEVYHDRSGGQLPAVFTRYRTASLWKGSRFPNDKLKSIGWQPRVSVEDGMRAAFQYWRTQEAHAR